MRESRTLSILLPGGYFAFLFLVLWVAVRTIPAPQPAAFDGQVPGAAASRPSDRE